MVNEKINFLQQGWECPKCGAVMSPSTSVCINCRGVGNSVASSTLTVPAYLIERVKSESTVGVAFPEGQDTPNSTSQSKDLSVFTT